MDYAKEALKLHREKQGKIEINSRVKVENETDLALAYTPGVAEPCLAIKDDINESYNLTRRGNLCAVITDGTAVLGLGDIGPEAGMPVMEGKCVLFKEFGGVDAFPLCIKTKDVDEFVETVVNISGSFGGINLEDISAPRCFEIEEKLKERCDIPIFHDDQHGTAIITLAGLTNALKVVGKDKNVKIVTSGSGAAGIAIVKLLLSAGFKNIVMTDRSGAIVKGREKLNSIKEKMAEITNPDNESGSLSDVIKGADVFIGISAPGLLNADMVKTMNEDAIIFACANPVPEILPDEAKAGGAKVIATGRSDFPNQINNVLAFPGIFRGTFDVRASEINEEMKMAAAHAIAEHVSDEEHKELSPQWVYDIFEDHYVNHTPYFCISECSFAQVDGIMAEATINCGDKSAVVDANGNGRLDAVSNAIKQYFGISYELSVYEEHALSHGSSSKAVAYVGITCNGKSYWGAGMDEDIIKASIHALTVAVNKLPQIQSDEKCLDERLVAMMNYMQTNYQTVTLEGMAQQFHLSTPYISKYIKEKSGKTFGEQVIAIRMKRAKTLLKNGNMTVENISHAVGYQNVENFSRQFKKNFQMTPVQYRNQNRVS